MRVDMHVCRPVSLIISGGLLPLDTLDFAASIFHCRMPSMQIYQHHLRTLHIIGQISINRTMAEPATNIPVPITVFSKVMKQLPGHRRSEI